MRRDTLRFVLAAVRNEEVARRQAAIDDLIKKGVAEPDRAAWLIENTPDKLSDDAVREVLKRQIKMRRDSIDAFTKGGRAELAANEQAQLDVIAGYLPTQLDEAAVEAAVRKAISDTGATGPKDMGKVIGAVRAAVGDQAEGRVVSAVAQRVLKERASA
ncbi:MAG TPA: GatB/YqeY domain-containing protein [Candidatus Limnocylindria bacterium]